MYTIKPVVSKLNGQTKYQVVDSAGNPVGKPEWRCHVAKRRADMLNSRGQK